MINMQGDIEVGEFQRRATNRLSIIFKGHRVIKEWDAAKDSQDAFQRGVYCPRLDIAVGPFNTDGRIEKNQQLIEEAGKEHIEFIKELLDLSLSPKGNVETFLEKKNQNPRCFMAIEIEKSGSRKHMLGDIANVSILGSVGVIVAYDGLKLEQFGRIKDYVNLATTVGKIGPIFHNVIIIEKDRFTRVLR